MVNYYEELKLGKSLTLDEINKQLSQLESTWKRREITNPEKATQILAMLIEARKVFKDSASRAEYERMLASSDVEPRFNDPGAARRRQLNKWYNDAELYYNRKELDLAKSAIEKALLYIDPSMEDPKVYNLAAHIYGDCKEYNQALNYVNKAIILEPSVGEYYLTKGFILGSQSVEANAQERFFDSNNLVHNSRDTIQIAIEKARASDDKYVLGAALGVLAASYYRLNPTDIQRAEQLAHEADSIGDAWNNARKVLDAIADMRIADKKKMLENDYHAIETKLQKEEAAERAKSSKIITDSIEPRKRAIEGQKRSLYANEEGILIGINVITVLLVAFNMKANASFYGILDFLLFLMLFAAIPCLVVSLFSKYVIIPLVQNHIEARLNKELQTIELERKQLLSAEEKRISELALSHQKQLSKEKEAFDEELESFTKMIKG